MTFKLNLTPEKLESLPAMPDVAHKLLALQLDTDAGETSLISLIAQDPLLSAKILGLANAPSIGAGNKINNISDAAMLLGMQRLKSVSIGVATLSMLADKPATKHFDPQDLWSHSMAIAIVMNSISRYMPPAKRPDENLIFLAGFLHDIGLMALHHIDSKASEALHHQVTLQPKRPIHELEMELLGITHSQIGAQLARRWNLPAEIISVVELHHAFSDNYVSTDISLARMISIAEKILADFGITEHTTNDIDAREWQELGIASNQVEEIASLANELAMQIVQMSEHQGMRTPDKREAPSEKPINAPPPVMGDQPDASKQTTTHEGVLHHSQIEIGRYLASISRENIPISANIGNDQIFISKIQYVNLESACFTVSYSEYKPNNSLIFKHATLEFIANYHGAHLTFKVLQPSDTLHEGQPALQFVFPRALLLHHRRQHKRIGIPKDISLNLISSWGETSPYEISVVDISMDGLGCILYRDASKLLPGTVLKDCRILLPNGTDIAVDLIVRHTSPTTLADGTIAYRTGVRFIQTPGEIEPLINHFVRHFDDKDI